MEPLQQCDHCVTGPANCGGGYVLDIEEHKSNMFTFSGGNEIDVLINLSFGASKYQLRVLAVGGGGGGSFCGGGSGYLQYVTRTLSGPTIMKLAVGDSGESSQVTVSGETIVAEAGQDSGGAVYCDGGYGGGDGDSSGSYHGGHGTGEDIVTFVLDNFILSPGDGGEHYSQWGGGGGGVLINGQGPDKGENTLVGSGYGGGGGYYSSSQQQGLEGVIVAEIMS